MEFIQHTINWTKGEILEAICFGIMGLLVLIAGLLFWKYGGTANARALVIPLIVVGLFFTAMGISGVYRNTQRIHEYQLSYQENPVAFVKAEKERVEGFENIFKYSFPIAAVFIIGGALLFYFFKGANIRAISLAFSVAGIIVYFIDYFAEERANIYFQEIMQTLRSL